jgi:hypothetical protein
MLLECTLMMHIRTEFVRTCTFMKQKAGVLANRRLWSLETLQSEKGGRCRQERQTGPLTRRYASHDAGRCPDEAAC